MGPNHNDSFNTQVQEAVNSICQTQSEDPIGYVPTRGFSVLPRGWKPNPDIADVLSGEIEGPLGEVDRFQLSKLGQYERVVFSALAWGGYHTYVLTGEMGSGKTAVAKHLADFVKKPRSALCSKCIDCDPVVVEINLNEGMNDKNVDRVTEKVRRKLYNYLRYEVKRLIGVGSTLKSFLSAVETGEPRDLAREFDLFLERLEALDRPTKRKKIKLLFDYIDAEIDSRTRLELLARLARWVAARMRPDSSCFVLFLDNLDSIVAEAQYDILVDVLSIQSIAKIKCLIALRRSTFERLNSQAAYSFGLINHTGPAVGEILRRRIGYHIENWNSIPAIQGLSGRYSKALYKRLLYLHEGDGRSSVYEFLQFLSGGSVRLGLYLSERLFINNTIPWEAGPRNASEMQRALLVGRSPSGTLSLDDKAIANLFSEPTKGTPSLINLRVIQLLWFYEDYPHKRSCLNVINVLRVVSNWSGSQIKDAINYLLADRRPLVWVDGRSRFATLSEMQSSDILYLTEAGLLYFEKLIHDIRYVQEALTALHWASMSDALAKGLYSTVERFRFLRYALRSLFEKDFEETARFDEWNSRNEDGESIKVEMISSRVIYSMGKAVVNILMSLESRDRYSIAEEAEEWQALFALIGTQGGDYVRANAINSMEEKFAWAAEQIVR